MQSTNLIAALGIICSPRTTRRFLRCTTSKIQIKSRLDKKILLEPYSINDPLTSLPNSFQQTRFISQRKLSRIKIIKKIMSYYNDYDDDFYEPVITHGESVVDRKSVFQGHCAAISRVEHVDIFLNKLKENKKIENAFHNMWAYRIDKSDPNTHVAGKSASIIQDCDDDGEQAAGGRLLNLLQILNVANVMVVVTRWYGGIQLGPARFKHINNAARDSLVKGGFVGNNDGDGSGTSQQDKSKAGKGSKSKKKSK